MKATLQRLEEIKRNGYRLDLGEAINEIFANYKKVALLGGAVLLLVGLAAMVLVGGITAVFIGVNSFTESMTDYTAAMLSSTGLIINLVVSVIGAGLLAPIFAGLVQMAHNASINEDFDFGTAFMHYKSVYFKEIFFASIIVSLVGSGLTTLLQILHLSNPSFALNAVIILISILIPLFTLVMIPLIIFGNLKAVDAIKGSVLLVSKNFWIILLLAIVVLVFMMLGIFALCIGIIFTIPAWYSMIYIIYKAAIPVAQINELDEIGQKFY